jgi:hypothetical protein
MSSCVLIREEEKMLRIGLIPLDERPVNPDRLAALADLKERRP